MGFYLEKRIGPQNSIDKDTERLDDNMFRLKLLVLCFLTKITDVLKNTKLLLSTKIIVINTVSSKQCVHNQSISFRLVFEER